MRKTTVLVLLAVVSFAPLLRAQKIGLPGGSADFSGASKTKPMRSGTSLPGTCEVGEFFYKTDATAGQNTYACTASNVWTLQGDGGGSGTSHNFLSSTHTDTVANTPVAGDLIFANSTPAWSRLSIGSNGQCLVVSGGTVAWGSCGSGAAHNLLSSTHSDTTAASVTRGDLLTGQGATPTWSRLALGASGRFLKSDGTDIVWSSGSAAGTGTCTNQFARGLNSDAAPTCASVAGTDFASQTANTVFAAPSGAAGTPSFRLLVDADVPSTLVRTSRAVNTSSPLGGGGALSADLTLTCPTCEVTGNKNAANGYAGLNASSQVASLNGGTENSYFAVTGPATAKRIFTFPNADATIEYQANKNAASGYAGLTAGTKLNAAQGQEVWAVTDLTSYAAASGTGTHAILATITTPATNDVLTWNGTNWVNQAGGGGGANAALSNLASVAVNISLLPGADNSIDLGSAAKQWKDIYFSGALIGGGIGPPSMEGTPGTCAVAAASKGKWCLSSTGNVFGYSYDGGAYVYPQFTNQKDAASGYAGLTAGTKLNAAQGQEVWASTDLSDFATKSGSGTTIMGATFTSLAANDLPIWNGANWVNSTAAPKATALAANGSNCATNQYAQGVDASGAAEGCAQLSTASLSDGADVVKRNQANTYSGGGLQDLSAQKLALPASTTLPGTCTANKEIFVDTDATPAGQQVYLCNSSGNGWNLIGDGGAGGGDNISVNGTAATDADFDDATPAAPSNSINVKWQKDALTPNNLSAYVPYAAPLTVTGGNLTSSFTASSADTLTNKTLDGEGTGNIITLTSKISAAAAGCNNATAGPSFDLPTANAPTPTCLGTSPHRFAVLDYADGSTQTAVTHFPLPGDWTGTVDAKLTYTGSTSSTNNIRWQVSNACVADAEDLLNPTYNTASASNSAGPTTAGQRRSVSFTSVAVTSCAAGESMFWKFERVGADAGDTYAGVAQLLEAEITLRRAQ